MTSSMGGDPIQICAVGRPQLRVAVEVVVAVGSVVETEGVLPSSAADAARGAGEGGLTAGGGTTSLAGGGATFSLEVTDGRGTCAACCSTGRLVTGFTRRSARR